MRWSFGGSERSPDHDLTHLLELMEFRIMSKGILSGLGLICSARTSSSAPVPTPPLKCLRILALLGARHFWTIAKHTILCLVLPPSPCSGLVNGLIRMVASSVSSGTTQHRWAQRSGHADGNCFIAAPDVPLALGC